MTIERIAENRQSWETATSVASLSNCANGLVIHEMPTMEGLKALADKFPKHDFPAYYRCHPQTFANLRDYLPMSTVERRDFASVEIRIDVTVPSGEFWPPDKYKFETYPQP